MPKLLVKTLVYRSYPCKQPNEQTTKNSSTTTSNLSNTQLPPKSKTIPLKPTPSQTLTFAMLITRTSKRMNHQKRKIQTAPKSYIQQSIKLKPTYESRNNPRQITSPKKFITKPTELHKTRKLHSHHFPQYQVHQNCVLACWFKAPNPYKLRPTDTTSTKFTQHQSTCTNSLTNTQRVSLTIHSQSKSTLKTHNTNNKYRKQHQLKTYALNIHQSN
eukprot:gene3248-2230_t